MIKLILRILTWTVLTLLGLICIVGLLLAFDNDSQTIVLSEGDKPFKQAPRTYIQSPDSSLYDALLAEFGQHKSLAKGFEIQCLIALSHYPELKEVPIDFLVEPAFIPLASRPDPVSVLFPWINRKYLVIISNESADFFEPILIRNLPFNEQVGVVGHELAHTVYYLDKSSFQLGCIAYCYEYENDFHTNFERDTDKRGVAHGLGHQLYDYAFFVRRAFGNSEEEIAAAEGGTYLSPNELLEEMGKYEEY